jgi:hypothetical protein
MWQIQLIYTDNNKVYTISMEDIERYVDKETIDKMKIGLLKEIAKL